MYDITPPDRKRATLKYMTEQVVPYWCKECENYQTNYNGFLGSYLSKEEARDYCLKHKTTLMRLPMKVIQECGYYEELFD